MPAIPRRDWIGAAGSAVMVIAAALLFYHVDRFAFWKDDFQLQYLPATREIVRAWREGSFPLLSRFSWFGGALAAEFQHGVFSIFLTACNFLVWSLPLQLTARAAMLSAIQLAVAASGAFLLGRSYGMRLPAAFCVAFLAAMNGWNLEWGSATWYPAISSFAWLPWYWLALRNANRRLAWLGGGLALYSLITAGWPYTILMAAMVTVLELPRARSRWAIVSAAALGLALSAPATLMLIEFFGSSFRLGYSGIIDPRWVVPVSNLIAFVLPTLRSPWTLWVADLPHSAVELAGGLVPITGLVAAAAARRWRLFRDQRGELILLLFVLILTLQPSVGIFRWPFRWLPFVHLLLAIVGLNMLDRLEAMRSGICCALVIIVACGLDALVDLQPAVTMRYGGVLLALAILWAISKHRIADALTVTVTIASVAVLFLFFPQPREVALWHFDHRILDSRPLDQNVRYLELARWWDDLTETNPREPLRAVNGKGESLRPGNTPMFAGVEFLNGYSPIGPGGLRALLGFDIHGPLRGEYLDSVAARETAPGALLDHMTVGGLVVARQWVDRAVPLLAQRGWSRRSRLPDGAVFTRPLRHDVVWSALRALAFADEQQAIEWIRQRRHSAMPVVFSGPGNELRQYAPRALSAIRNNRLSASAVVGPATSNLPSLIVFSRPWFPGYVASIGGRDVPVIRADLIMPAVELRPGDQGLLVVRYRPRSLVIGVIVALAGVVAAAVALVWRAGGVTDSTM